MKYEIKLIPHLKKDIIVVEETDITIVEKMKKHQRMGSMLKFPDDHRIYIVGEVKQVLS